MHCLETIVVKHTQITSDIFVLDVLNPDLTTIPGQFFMLKSWDTEPTFMRPISIYKADDKILSFMYRVVGKGTTLISLLKENDKIKILGPCGNGYPIQELSGKIAVVGGGVGIPPLCQTSKILTEKSCSVDAYLGYKDEVFAIDDFKKHCNSVLISTENGIMGTKGFVTDILTPEKYDYILTCGPEIMMRKVVEKSKKSKAIIYCSLEHRMACGLGACLGCSIKTNLGMQRVCKDGPVFVSNILNW